MGCKKVPERHQRQCENWHRKKQVPRTSEYEITSRDGGQERGKGEVNLPPGIRKKGRKEEGKKERENRNFEDLKI